MRIITIVLLALCLLLAVSAHPDLSKRKGGGGGKGGGSSGGGSKGTGGGGSKGTGSSGSASKNTGLKAGGSGGGGSTGKGSGTLGDRPPSYASLFPSRAGFNAGGRPVGTYDASRSYTPPPAYSASASYVSVSRGQTLPAYTLKSNSPAVYYASTTRSTYGGAWGYGFYPIYPYPFWAYGAGYWAGSTYYPNTFHHSIYNYHNQLRNITVLNGTNIPLVGDQDIFSTGGKNITLTDFNNGTIQIAPCGNSTSADLGVGDSDCGFIVLNIKDGSVVRGSAKTEIHDEITFFQLSLGNRTSTLRTQTISSTKKKPQAGPVVGIVLGSVAFVAIVIGLLWWFACRKK
ncbi:hypothetical protein H4R99_005540 [Coemansia sp. RSA 1722]|nr:hypothetical protein LPJ57_003568 [Coemansia sp. RSA 486]KAJ2237414.1 hypothetical protein IWW45_000943 [Coemansia sp. RSA 485]KAJ2594978.1 hypothetical protein H4R99_005540 [Coemansia sp. RSA 1722]